MGWFGEFNTQKLSPLRGARTALAGVWIRVCSAARSTARRQAHERKRMQYPCRPQRAGAWMDIRCRRPADTVSADLARCGVIARRKRHIATLRGPVVLGYSLVTFNEY